ncbi:translation elongation factor [Plantibacter sp. H53]|uniref:FBP domain-containing protein n=1 Tax=Plantibacter sp. H53 TaxID=1827323 RepID=UPI0007D93C1B|nr:FBP domain-containing protein [Plantibacter sp. H53]OAN26869.1 translation elongation factor [Plantibacter sp. H53]
MIPLNESQIRASFVNASRKEVSDVSLPVDLDAIDFEVRDFLGWRDKKLPRRAYVVTIVDGEPVGILLRQADATPRTRPQCAWCQDITLSNDVVFYSAKRAGQAGKNGDTVGTLVCADFQCSANVRKLPPLAYVGFDAEAARQERIATLGVRAVSFASSVLNGVG